MRFRLSSALTVAALAGVANAQNFNIDVSDLTGSPANTYGAATGQVGHWNVLIGGPPYAASLNNLANAPTSVTTNVVAVGNGTGDFSFNNAGTGGNDEFLMDDCQDVGNGGTVPPSETTWTFAGLNPVNYDITVYSWAPDNAAFISTVGECGSGTTFMVGGAWPGGFAIGITHVQFSACATGGTIEICVNSGGVNGTFSSVNGYQFTETGGTCGGSGTPQCFGSASCPCGNNSTNNGGCDNSLAGTGGAILASSGTASLAADTLVLTATNTTNQPGVFFQGDNGLNPPPVFGDGLRCCGQNVVRCGTYLPAANTTNTDTGNQIGGNSPPISDIGPNAANLVPGSTRCYQWWYRDPSGGPCGAGFNLSNALSVIWSA
jgi:hypothetical protein